TDEPALHIAGWWNSKITEDRLPMLPWVDGFAEYFYARKGYEIGPRLPCLLHDLVPDASKVRCDYWEVVSGLILESYFVQISQWCARHGIAFTGHLLLEESLMLHLMFSGSLYRCVAAMDIPGIDLLGSTLGETMPEWGGPWVPKFVSSAAHASGKSEVMSESFAGSGAEMTLETLVAMANWQFVLGVTELLPMSIHYFTHTPKRVSEEDLKDFRKDAFFDDPSFYATYLGRLKTFLGGGRHVADVALLMPETSIRANYTPAGIGLSMDEYRKASPVAARIDDSFLALTEGLLENQIDFDYLDDEAFLSAQMDDGKLRIADETYSILVLPSSTTLRWAVIEKIRDFRQSGGIVVAFGTLPHEAVERGKDDAVREAVAEMFAAPPAGTQEGVTPVHASEIDGVVEAIRKEQKADVCLARPDPKVYYLHKRKAGCDIYFLVNNEERPKTLDVTFRCRGTPEIFDPRTGAITEVQPLSSGEDTRLSIDLDKLSAVLIVFSN
ncbi:MAG: glycosyl hydrolase, partial [Planctomycetia bacterium]|nr:glycosyl hydrolase [Planctomycetia bacterium]